MNKKRKFDTIVQALIQNPKFLEDRYLQTPDTATIDCIPDDILLEIICMIPPNFGDKLAPTARVCKKWREIWLSEKSKKARLRNFFRESIRQGNASFKMQASYNSVPLLFAFDILLQGTCEILIIQNYTPYLGGPREARVYFKPMEKPVLLNSANIAEWRLEHTAKREIYINLGPPKKFKIKDLWKVYWGANFQRFHTNIHLNQPLVGVELFFTEDMESKIDSDGLVTASDLYAHFSEEERFTPVNYHPRMGMEHSDLVTLMVSMLKEYGNNPSKFTKFEENMSIFRDVLNFC